VGFIEGLLSTARRRPSVTWKIVKIDEPVLESTGLRTQYGVVISSDAMLAATQTLLFCPLINGLDEDKGLPIETMPWHVEVRADRDETGRLARLPYSRALLSTKIVLPISRNEIDGDGLSRGWLSKESQRAASARLKLWLPPFRYLSR
jgi:hypothetical protein